MVALRQPQKRAYTVQGTHLPVHSTDDRRTAPDEGHEWEYFAKKHVKIRKIITPKPGMSLPR